MEGLPGRGEKEGAWGEDAGEREEHPTKSLVSYMGSGPAASTP